MSLLFGFNLQSVLNLTEEAISPVKIDNFRSGDELQARQSAQSIERTGLLQENMTPAMNELQRLHDEFDLADSAAAEFNVPFQGV